MYHLALSEFNLAVPPQSTEPTQDSKKQKNFYQNINKQEDQIKTKQGNEVKTEKLIGMNEYDSSHELKQRDICDLIGDADEMLLSLVRRPVELNHPRGYKSKHAAAMIHSGEVFCVCNRDKLLQCFNSLTMGGYSSAPVLDENNQYIDMIDLFDILFYILRCFGLWRNKEQLNDPSKHDQYWNEYSGLESIQSATVQDALQRPVWSYRYKYKPIKQGYSTLSAIEILLRENLHRIPILSKTGIPTSILTRSMIISLIDQEEDQFTSLLKMKVKHIIPTLITNTLYTVEENSLLIYAFQKIVENNISSVAIINKEGKLIDCLTRRDIRGLGISKLENFQMLWKYSVIKYKQFLKEEFPIQTPNTPIIIKINQTIKELIKLMDDGNIHRIFVINDDGILTNVISQSDLLRYILHELGLKC